MPQGSVLLESEIGRCLLRAGTGRFRFLISTKEDPNEIDYALGPPERIRHCPAHG